MSRAQRMLRVIAAGCLGLGVAGLGVPGVFGQQPDVDRQPSLLLREPLPPSKGELLAPAPAVVDGLAWWEATVLGPMNLGKQSLPISVESLVMSTLQHSSQVRVLCDKAIVRRFVVDEASAKFDFRSFMETKFTDTSDPVGNKLTTGGPSRYLDQNWNYAAGIRRQTSTGAQAELSQRMGYEGSNSVFFSPNPQGTAKLAVTLTQPLLNGAGRAYQTSTILLAEAEAGAARDQLARDLQSLLFEVHRNYWELYVQRSALLQKRKLYDQAQWTWEELNARRDVDVLGSQLVRAKAAIARREAAVIRLATSVKNAESRLRAIVNDPTFSTEILELVPTEPPTAGQAACDLEDSLTAALQYRPEINQTLKQIDAASIRTGVAKKELLPMLNLVVGSYMYGLAGQGDIGASLGNQFDQGRPTYWAGLTFDVPLGNRAAVARARQRQVELRQYTHELQAVTATVRSEVEIAVREVTTLQREWESKGRAIVAVQNEIDNLTARWRLLPGEGQETGVLLEDLLNAQERLADAELGYVTAQAASSLALVQLQRATGQLIAYEQLAQVESGAVEFPSITPSRKETLTPPSPPPVTTPRSKIVRPDPSSGKPKSTPAEPIERGPEQELRSARLQRLPPIR